MGGAAPHKLAPSKAALAKAAAAKHQASLREKAAAAKSEKIKALEAAIGGRPAWVDAYNTANKGKSVIAPTMWTDGSLQYVSNNLAYYNPSGKFSHQEGQSSGGFFDMVGDALRSADPLKLAGDAAGDIVKTVGSGVEAAVKNPLGQIAIAALLPGVGAAIGSSLTSAGILTSAASASAAATAAGATAAGAAAAGAAATATATAVGTAIASTAVQVAQGKPLEQAIVNGVVGAAVNINVPGATKALTEIINSPAVANAIVNAAGSVTKIAAAGGNSDQIAASLAGSLASSGVTAAVNTAVPDLSPQAAKVLGATISGGINNGVEGAAKGAIDALISEASKPNVSPTTTPTDDVKALPPEQVAAFNLAELPEENEQLISLEKAPELPDNTITKVLTDAGLIPGDNTNIINTDFAKDKTEDKLIEEVLADAGLLDKSTNITQDGELGGFGLSVPKNSSLGDLDSFINEGAVIDSSPSDMGGGAGLLSTGDVALPSLPNMGNAPGLSVPTNTIIGDTDSLINNPDVLANTVPGTVTEAGVTAPDKSVPLGDPNSFINTGTLPKSNTPVAIKVPVAPSVAPKQPTTSATPAKSTDPVEQLYQTTTQSQPTTLADIQYYLDMTGTDIFPAKNRQNSVESLLNQSSQPTSTEELLRYLRS